jgi:hypothetical protein
MSRNGLAVGSLLLLWIACASGAPAKRPPLTGSWGGAHIALEITSEGGRIEYDCAQGTIDGHLVLDKAGRFKAAGTHTTEHGGPVREGEESTGRPARYQGKVAGKNMTLTVTLTDSGENLGTFTLTRDAAPRLTKCL